MCLWHMRASISTASSQGHADTIVPGRETAERRRLMIATKAWHTVRQHRRRLCGRASKPEERLELLGEHERLPHHG
jgi:hypothetical protein